MAAREVTVHLIDGFGAKCGVCVCWPIFNGPLLSAGGEGEREVNCPDCLARAEPGGCPERVDKEAVNADASAGV